MAKNCMEKSKMITIIFDLNHIIPFKIRTEQGLSEYIALNICKFENEIECGLQAEGWRNTPYRIKNISVSNYEYNVVKYKKIEVFGDVKMEIELK